MSAPGVTMRQERKPITKTKQGPEGKKRRIAAKSLNLVYTMQKEESAEVSIKRGKGEKGRQSLLTKNFLLLGSGKKPQQS